MNVKIKIGIFFLLISMSSVLQASLYVNGVETSIEAGWATYSSWSIPKGNDAYTTNFDATTSNMFDGNENHDAVRPYAERTGAPLGAWWATDYPFSGDWTLTLAEPVAMEKIEICFGDAGTFVTLGYTLKVDYEVLSWVTIGSGEEGRSLGTIVDSWDINTDYKVERIQLSCSGASGATVSGKLDQMNIYAIPEPFTATVLCLGAVGFLRKRHWSIK